MVSPCICLWIIHKKRWEKGTLFIYLFLIEGTLFRLLGTLFIKDILGPEELRLRRALDRQACRPEQRQL
jgi:hypothetical protein